MSAVTPKLLLSADVVKSTATEDIAMVVCPGAVEVSFEEIVPALAVVDCAAIVVCGLADVD